MLGDMLLSDIQNDRHPLAIRNEGPAVIARSSLLADLCLLTNYCASSETLSLRGRTLGKIALVAAEAALLKDRFARSLLRGQRSYDRFKARIASQRVPQGIET